MKNKLRLALGIVITAYMVHTNAIVISASDKSEGSYIKQEYIDYCIEIGEEVGLCPYILVALIESESSGKMSAQNGNCIGLCQVNKKCHSKRAENLGVSLDDAYGNIRTAADYIMEISESYDEYGESIDFVLDVYNTGNNKRAMKNYENGTMCKYSAKILKRSAELEEYYYGVAYEQDDEN